MTALISAIIFCVALGGTLQAQASPEESSLVLRSTTRLMQVNVVVKDKRGRPVPDLQKDDFVILDRGKPQRVNSFSVDTREKRGAEPPAAALPPNVFSNRPEHRSGMPNSVTVILLDGLNTSWKDRRTAAEHLVGYLEQIQPGDPVAVYALGRTLRILHDYTMDPKSLLKAFANYRRAQKTLIVSASPTNMGTPAVASQPQGNPEGTLEDRAIRGILDAVVGVGGVEPQDRIKGTLKAFEAISRNLASIPGRKNLVWVSSAMPLSTVTASLRFPWMRRPETSKAIYAVHTSFPEETRRAVRALNDANIAVYPVDPRGFSLATFNSPEIVTMKDLAKKTGGKAYYDRDDVMGSIREAIDDSSLSYTLTYYPSEHNEDGRFRDIVIRVKRPGVKVRHRKGYFDLPSDRPKDEESREAELRDAVWSPLDATGVRIDARLDFTTTPETGGLLAHILTDPASVTLDQKEGRWTGRLEFLFLQTDELGRQHDITTHTLRLSLLPETYNESMKTGFVFRLELPRKSGADKLRIVVCDDPSGRIGSVTIPFGRIVEDLAARRD